ncbi:disease resistance protein RPM1-like [Ipomoea triloba]|uniref:disease resistance protein RPM1-like n=1 Tax=Ipomoea triloba TaxID=35885 RepID=UPI00125D683D|nr:disease resistance protein RPM1-like [Ipomoea triloba]XP_031113156.1 disease resistance protein RPM1-like [Ipomoea triloba]
MEGLRLSGYAQLYNYSLENTEHMAECAVVFVLDKITVLLEAKVVMLHGLKHEIEYIKDELERVIAFLGVADTVEDGDAEIKVWVKQVRDVAYDIEDAIDEFMLLPAGHQSSIFCGFLWRFFFSIRNLKPRRKIAYEIQGIKSRVRSIAEGHHRYRYRYNVPEQVSSTSHAYEIANDRRSDALLLEEDEIVGIESPRKELISLLLKEDPTLKVISVVGMGGSGKTTLVKKVYDDAAVKKHFQSHAWITVSQTFKVEEVLKDMIQQLFAELKQPVPEGMSSMNANKLKVIVKEFLLRRRYVIVFDDVWSIRVWEAIKHVLLKEKHGCRVVISTRLMDVASSFSIDTNGYIYEMKPLSEDVSWVLLCRKAFYASSCPSHLREILKQILKRCGGLPLAIVAIGGVLATKNRTNINEWGALYHSLGPDFEGNDQFESLRIILLLSFNDLPQYLKLCFLYLSIYPEDHLIEHNTLIYQWTMENFVKQKEGRTVEEVAEGYLIELINRSLILPVKLNDDGSMKQGRVHDLYREIILSKSRDHNFIATTDEETAAWPEKARRLSVHGTLGNVPMKRQGTKLRSLLTFNVTDSQFSSHVVQILSSCRVLKVLELRGTSLEIVPEEIFQLLHLRYLSLRSTKVKVLPRSIKKLRMLEILDLKHTYITELPGAILELQHLRHLLVYGTLPYSYLPYDCSPGFKAPPGIGKLRYLQKLAYIDFNPGSGVIEEIGKLNELKRLCIQKLRTEDGKAMCLSLGKLHKLRSLNLKSIEEDVILDVNYLSSPPPLLQNLYLTGSLRKMPPWIKSLHNLVKVYFRWSKLEDDPLELLQDLPNLVHLEFLVGYTGETLHFNAGKFRSLRLLNLDKLEELRSVVIDEGAMPHLERLVIQRCSFMERVPVGIECLINLKYLEFFDMPDEFISSFVPDKQGEDYCKVSHIPEVYCTYWKDGFWEVNSLEEKHGSITSRGPGNAAAKITGRRNSL